MLAAQRENRYGEPLGALLTFWGEAPESVILEGGMRPGLDGNRSGIDMDGPALRRSRLERKLRLVRGFGARGTSALAVGRTQVPGVA